MNLKADTASQEDKESLAASLFYLRQPSTGSLDGDVRKFAAEIEGLVTRLGLKTSLEQYKVPKDDLPGIATRAMGGSDKPHFAQVVELLESIF